MTSTASRSEIDEDRWFFGQISGQQASEHLFTAGGEDGTFLIRESCSSPGHYVLSFISYKKPIDIFICKYMDDAFYSLITDSKKIFHGLDSLVAHYCENPIGGPAGTVLKTACIGEGPPPETRLHGFSNLLHRAVDNANIKVVTELLKSGYRKIDAKNNSGQTALHIASINGHESIARLLLTSGATVDVRDLEGLTPLQQACKHNNATIVRLLIREGKANIQLRSPTTGEVALHEAAAVGSLTCIKVLLENHAPAWPRSLQKYTPASLAKANKHSECYEFLVSRRPPLPQVLLPEYYHGTLIRSDAETLLLSSPESVRTETEGGIYLLRRSARNSSVFVISLAKNGKVFHYEIQRQHEMFFIDDGPLFKDLETLVCHYSRFVDGLPCRLETPLAPYHPLNDEEFTKVYKQSSKTPRQMRKNLDQLSCRLPKTVKVGHKSDSIDSPSPHFLIKDVELMRQMSYTLLSVGTTGRCKGGGEPYGDIDSNDLKILHDTQLGTGEFGEVLKGIWSSSSGDDVEVAVKILHQKDPVNRESFIREAKFMMNLNHPYIIKLIGVCHQYPIAMVQELASMGGLLDLLLKNPAIIKPEFHFQLWAAQIAEGMRYLESCHYVHRDLAARNLLLGSITLVKISDFGLSRALGFDDYYRSTNGGKWPLKWYAPESINFGTFSHSTDVWSYGITLWEMYTYGDQPYGTLNGQQVIELIQKDERLPKPPVCPDSNFNLMLSCWESNPVVRPTFSKILTHFKRSPYFCYIQPYLLTGQSAI